VTHSTAPLPISSLMTGLPSVATLVNMIVMQLALSGAVPGR
jgi:hypothetical protein